MHFKKPRVGTAALTVLMLLFFFILLVINIIMDLKNTENTGADPSLDPSGGDAVSLQSDGAQTDPDTESALEAVTYEQVFESGFNVRRIDAVYESQLPEGCGAVIEETHDIGWDFSSHDGLVRVTDKSLLKTQIDVDGIETRFMPSGGAPTVVIYHTHTTEGYAQKLDTYYPLGSDGIAQSAQTSVVAAGNVLANELTRLGANVVHITDTFDSPSRSGSFTRSKAALMKQIEKLDRVDLVIDLHRGVIQQTGGARVKPTVYVNGYRAAQISITAGASQTDQFAAALSLQRRIVSVSPLLCMPVSLESQTYNFDIPVPAVMVEIGTDRNTADEAKLTAAVLAQAVYEMLSEKD